MTLNRRVFISIALMLLLTHKAVYAENIIEVAAAPEKGFEYPFFLSVPDKTQTHFLVVETNNTGAVSDNFEQHFESARKAILGNSIGPWVARKLNAPMLIPVFPRSETDWQTYTHALDRDTLIVSEGKLTRIDLQLLAMITEAKKLLNTQEVSVNEKVIMTGFSASGSFANRFSLMHPKALKVVVAGGLNGILMLPVNKLENKPLGFPLGVNDFEKLVGSSFDVLNWQSLPQFLFMGAEDNNDAVKFDDAYADSERQLIYELLGEEMQPTRWQNCQKLYKQHKANVVFRTYQGISHGTNSKIHRDILAFIKENI